MCPTSWPAITAPRVTGRFCPRAPYLLVRLHREIARETCHAIQIQNIIRLVARGIQPYVALPDIHRLELVERLIRRGYYMGPMNSFSIIGGGGSCGSNPFDLMELIRRTPHGSFFTYQTSSD
jgi:hypothetical protein